MTTWRKMTSHYMSIGKPKDKHYLNQDYKRQAYRYQWYANYAVTTTRHIYNPMINAECAINTG